jgi:hypothetical protein
MKHLKNFNESNLSKVNLNHFCQINLAYLIDDGFKIKIKKNNFSNENRLDIDIKKYINGKKVIFTYNEIKDDFIPFLYNLNNNYNICCINFWHNKDFTNYSFFNRRGYQQSDQTIEDLIEDKISSTNPIREMTIEVKNN